MPSRKTLIVSAALAARVALAQQCGALPTFEIVGTTDDGAINGGFAVVQDPTGVSGTNTIIFSTDETTATRFSLTADNRLITQDGILIANTDAGLDLTWLFFDTQAAIDAEAYETAACFLAVDNTLTCATTAAGTLQFCNSFLSIGNGVNADAGCVGITVAAANIIPACNGISSSTTTTTETSSTTGTASTTITNTNDATITGTATITQFTTSTVSPRPGTATDMALN